jgi:hypothetical protein
MDHEDGTISPARAEGANLLSGPHAYEALVDTMPSCPARVILQALGYVHGLYPTRAARTRPPGREVTLVLHVEGATAIDLTVDGSDPFVAARATLTNGDQAPVVHPDSVAGDGNQRAPSPGWLERICTVCRGFVCTVAGQGKRDHGSSHSCDEV